MSRIKDYIQGHIDCCYEQAMLPPYNQLIGYGDCIELVCNAVIDVTDKYRELIDKYEEKLVLLRYDKNDSCLHMDFLEEEELDEYYAKHQK